MLWVLGEAILMSTYNMCFYGELTKNYPLIILKYPPYLFHCKLVGVKMEYLQEKTPEHPHAEQTFLKWPGWCVFFPDNTIMVMSNQSVNLSTLFLGRLPKRLASTKGPYFYQ